MFNRYPPKPDNPDQMKLASRIRASLPKRGEYVFLGEGTNSQGEEVEVYFDVDRRKILVFPLTTKPK